MKYACERAMEVFSREPENFHKPLTHLEQAFIEAGLNIWLEGCVLPVIAEHKIVSIYRDGAMYKAVSIEGDSPAMAVADIARGIIPI